MTKKPKAHIAKEKKETLTSLVKYFKDCPIVGIANFESLPAAQLQVMRGKFRGKAEFFMTKKRIIKLAIEEAKKSNPDLAKISEHLVGMPALLFSKENPFSLYKLIKKNKTPAPAKPGQKAPKEIVVRAGPTPFAPGPVISELSQLGIKSGVEEGKIVIKEDKIVANEGDVISSNLASMLLRLGIQPMEIGINIVAVYENGLIYSKKVLDIDEKEFMNKITSAIKSAEGLAVEVCYPTKRTIKSLVQKAFLNSKAIAVSQGILAKGIVENVLAKAHAQMLSVKTLTEGGG
ncbi:50S ribosomal protein L10 [Candidatus Woesearchaeota archaeon]|nr:50S ribosomal protein L10 [Candidatus Woesearchaeota archaeon]